MGIVSLAVIKLSLIALFGFILYRKNYISDEILGFLTFFVIYFTVPCLIFSHLVNQAQAILNNSIWVFIGISVAIFFGGYLLGLIFSYRHKGKLKQEFISAVSFQNSGYLPMNIALFLFSGRLREEFLVYIFLNLLGFNIIMWSVGSFFIFKREGEKFKLKSLFSPPVTTTLVALFLIYARLNRFIPDILITPVSMVGETSFVLSMIILGSFLAKIKLEGLRQQIKLVIEVSLLKLVFLPSIFLLATLVFGVSSLLGLFVVLQAAMPSAASLPIVANLKRADSEFISQAVLITHLASVLTIPFWLGLYFTLSGFSLI